MTASEHSAPYEIAIDFDFKQVNYRENIEHNLPKEALVLEGYFVHIERIFKISAMRLLIKCALGSFDRPEHKYILLTEEGCRYFVSPPVKTRVNFLAHTVLLEQLN